MQQVVEIMDSWMKSQKELLNSWVASQKDGASRWVEATAKLQETLQGCALPKEGPAKEMRTFCDALLGAAVSSTKAIAEDSGTMQEAWKGAVEKQLELAGGVMKQFAGLFQPVAAQK